MPKIIVDHNGMCEGVYFKAGVPVEATESMLTALGKHARRMNVVDKVVEAVKPKQVTVVKNKMVNRAPVKK